MKTKTKYALKTRTVHCSGTLASATTDGSWVLPRNDNKIPVWDLWKKY